MVRIEYAALATWVSGLVPQMLAASVAARERAQQARAVTRPGLRLGSARGPGGGPSPLARRRPPPGC